MERFGACTGKISKNIKFLGFSLAKGNKTQYNTGELFNLHVNFNVEAMQLEYTIKEMAALAGLPAHALRYYEKEGLLPRVERESNGFRRYTEQDAQWLRVVCDLRDTGMPLAQIKEFTQLTQMGGSGLDKRCEILKAHCRAGREQLKQTGQKLDRLEALEQ